MAKKVVSIVGVCDKRALCLPLADMISEYGTVLLITDNEFYKYLNENYESEFSMSEGAVNVMYTDRALDIGVNITNAYDIILFDTALYIHPDSNVLITVMDQYEQKLLIKEPKRITSLKFRYSSNTKKSVKGYVNIQKAADDEISFMATSNKPKSIYLFASMVMAAIFERPPKEMLNELMEGEYL